MAVVSGKSGCQTISPHAGRKVFEELLGEVFHE
jgi:hypothetical protein